ncbi:MAG: hypothetical protein ABJB40_01805 [Acidobacteriota bacterium]
MEEAGTQAKRIVLHLTAVTICLLSLVSSGVRVTAQTAGEPAAVSSSETTTSVGAEAAGFRIEKIRIEGGAELITILAKSDVQEGEMTGPTSEIPLVSILRDTLGDEQVANDRLRYVWLLTYTKPTLTQKLSAFVPFLYMRTTVKKRMGADPPPPVLDVQPSDNAVWNQVFWVVFKKLVVSGTGLGLRASAVQFRQNALDYRKSAIAGALTVLSLYQEVAGEKVLSDQEMKDIQARLVLSDKMFGGSMRPENLGRVYQKDLANDRDMRGHNWELLRQFSEAQGLYFDPLEMPDGTTRHAIVWTTAEDIAANKGKKFDKRFLNFKDPWSDEKLVDWKGFTQTRWYDADNREVEPDTPSARSRTMIPLALYGLDNPRIPALLVDFRNNGNPKMREISKRVLTDAADTVLGLSHFGGMPFLIGRFVYDFTTGRRGWDVNQASRLRAYAQLKLLLSLDASLDTKLSGDIARRIGSSTINPLENDPEADLARVQYENLKAFAKRPDGLPAKVMNDRREEMTRLKHGRVERTLLSAARFLSLGLFVHRERSTPELLAQMDVRRQLDYHERIIKEIAFASVDPEVDSNNDVLKQSLLFISQNGSAADEKTTRALVKIFAISDDEDARSLSLAALYRVNNSTAKKELLSIYNDPKLDDRWRNICAHYLKLALQEGQRISASDAQAIASITQTTAN